MRVDTHCSECLAFKYNVCGIELPQLIKCHPCIIVCVYVLVLHVSYVVNFALS
jgi:hypothetical protein